MSDSSKAVFLSYASQDAEAARRICDALRAAGIEVWFDQSELRGGDAWDQKIRRQIKDCALFVPVISANTQARAEGYFRLEWLLAVERSRLMADHVAFLVPVVIDDTKDAAAFVPDKFREVQWTRIAAGEPSGTFCERVQTLLGGSEVLQAAFGVAERGLKYRATFSSPQGGKRGPWIVPALIAGVAIGALAFWQPWRISNSPASSAAKPGASAPLSEARKLAAKADALFDQGEYGSRETLGLAEQFCKQAMALDANDAEVWAVYSRVASHYIFAGHDRTQERRAQASEAANRAVRLNPNSFETRYALAYFYRLEDASYREGERILRGLLAEKPTDGRIWRTLGIALRMGTNFAGNSRGRDEEAVECLRKAVALPGGDPIALGWLCSALLNLGRFDEAERALEEAIALSPQGITRVSKVSFLLRYRGDLPGARKALEHVAVDLLRQDFGGFSAAQTWGCAREPEKVIDVLRAIPRDYLEAVFDGPKGLLMGLAHRLAGRPQAAEIEWRAALQVIDRRLSAQTNNVRLLIWKSRLLACLGETEEARRLFQAAEQLGFSTRDAYWAATIAVELRDIDKAIGLLSVALKEPSVATRAFLRINPTWDSLRGDPRFEAIAAEPVVQRSDQSGAKPDLKSVAVLAFANLSDDKENEYFSDGISEELISVLCRVPGLTVKGQTSAFYFKDKKASSAEIAQQLGVAFLVRGGVRRMGNTVRITAQLTRAATDEVLWSSAPLTRELKEVFAVQEEIAGMIARELSLKLGTKANAAVVSVHPEAFELYLQARRAWSLRTEAALSRAEQLLGRALELDPRFARAHAALADVWNARSGMHTRLIGAFGQRNSPEFVRIIAKISHALTLDPDSADAHTSMGGVLWQGWKFAEAERSLRHAIALSPNLATAHQWLGRILEVEGRIEEAIVEMRRAAELDPLSPIILANLASRLNHAGRFREALEVAERALGLQSDSFGLSSKADALAGLGRIAEAVAIIRGDGLSRAGPQQARILALAGEKEEAAKLLAEAEALRGRAAAAVVWLALGEREKAIASLQADTDTISVGRLGLFLYGDMQPIRDTPEFKRFIAELGLTEAFARAQAWRAAKPPEKVETRK